MAASNHPSFRESIIIIGAGLAFTLDHWDEFMKEFGEDFEIINDKTNDELKNTFTHLFQDMATQLEQDDIIENVMNAMRNILKGI